MTECRGGGLDGSTAQVDAAPGRPRRVGMWEHPTSSRGWLLVPLALLLLCVIVDAAPESTALRIPLEAYGRSERIRATGHARRLLRAPVRRSVLEGDDEVATAVPADDAPAEEVEEDVPQAIEQVETVTEEDEGGAGADDLGLFQKAELGAHKVELLDSMQGKDTKSATGDAEGLPGAEDGAETSGDEDAGEADGESKNGEAAVVEAGRSVHGSRGSNPSEAATNTTGTLVAPRMSMSTPALDTPGLQSNTPGAPSEEADGPAGGLNQRPPQTTMLGLDTTDAEGPAAAAPAPSEDLVVDEAEGPEAASPDATLLPAEAPLPGGKAENPASDEDEDEAAAQESTPGPSTLSRMFNGIFGGNKAALEEETVVSGKKKAGAAVAAAPEGEADENEAEDPEGEGDDSLLSSKGLKPKSTVRTADELMDSRDEEEAAAVLGEDNEEAIATTKGIGKNKKRAPVDPDAEEEVEEADADPDSESGPLIGGKATRPGAKKSAVDSEEEEEEVEGDEEEELPTRATPKSALPGAAAATKKAVKKSGVVFDPEGDEDLNLGDDGDAVAPAAAPRKGKGYVAADPEASGDDEEAVEAPVKGQAAKKGKTAAVADPEDEEPASEDELASDEEASTVTKTKKGKYAAVTEPEDEKVAPDEDLASEDVATVVTKAKKPAKSKYGFGSFEQDYAPDDDEEDVDGEGVADGPVTTTKAKQKAGAAGLAGRDEDEEELDAVDAPAPTPAAAKKPKKGFVSTWFGGGSSKDEDADVAAPPEGEAASEDEDADFAADSARTMPIKAKSQPAVGGFGRAKTLPAESAELEDGTEGEPLAEDESGAAPSPSLPLEFAPLHPLKSKFKHKKLLPKSKKAVVATHPSAEEEEEEGAAVDSLSSMKAKGVAASAATAEALEEEEDGPPPLADNPVQTLKKPKPGVTQMFNPDDGEDPDEFNTGVSTTYGEPLDDAERTPSRARVRDAADMGVLPTSFLSNFYLPENASMFNLAIMALVAVGMVSLAFYYYRNLKPIAQPARIIEIGNVGKKGPNYTRVNPSTGRESPSARAWDGEWDKDNDNWDDPDTGRISQQSKGHKGQKDWAWDNEF